MRYGHWSARLLDEVPSAYDIIAYVFSYCINNVIGINTRMLKVENKDCIGIGVGM